MRQEKYLDKAISKLEKDLRKTGLSDMYTIDGRIQDRIPILDIHDDEAGVARSYNLANAYIMYLEEDVSAAESFKDMRKNIMEDIRRDHPIEIQAEETFPLQNPFADIGGATTDNISAIDFSRYVDHSDDLQDENQEDAEEERSQADLSTDIGADCEEQLTPHPQQAPSLVIHEQDDLELEHEYYESYEETNMPDTYAIGYDRMQEFDDYDTNYESEFASKMKELFEWKEPETSFLLRSENGIHNLYVGETGIVINLTEANERYQTNSQSFLEIGLDLYNNDYKERIAEQIRERVQSNSDEERENPTKEEDSSEIDTEEYDDDYFPF